MLSKLSLNNQNLNFGQITKKEFNSLKEGDVVRRDTITNNQSLDVFQTDEALILKKDDNTVTILDTMMKYHLSCYANVLNTITGHIKVSLKKRELPIDKFLNDYSLKHVKKKIDISC